MKQFETLEDAKEFAFKHFTKRIKKNSRKMKKMVLTLLCKILQQLNASVAINLEIDGKLKGKTNQAFYYSNDFRNAIVLDCNNDELVIPEGKFNINIEKK